MKGNLHACRSCGSKNFEVFLDLGSMPLADRMLMPKQLDEAEPYFPLEVAFCHDCTLVQITETVAPEILFDADYPYFSSFSEHLLKHSRQNALELIEARKLGADSLVAEIASNDGYLLKNFVEAGIPVLGIDPANGPVEAARAAGVNTMHAFFGLDLAKRAARRGQAGRRHHRQQRAGPCRRHQRPCRGHGHAAERDGRGGRSSAPTSRR